MKVLELEGKTVDDATKRALKEFGLNEEDVKIEIVDQGKSGIFGFGVSRPAKIRVYYSENTMDVGGLASEVLVTILSKMDIDGRVKDLKEGENKVYIEIDSAQSGLIIGRKGRTLESLQFIVNLIVNHQTNTEKKIILDIESYRAKREKALRKISKEVALKVVRTGRPWTLEPMNPFERRLIHLTLQNDTRVTTKSEGEGIYRKVKVSPRGPK
ncbi:MAG TPA: RNA-binding cell elongation regulator Jag/EloR [Spirochaetota bacterium]|nr:RNA-binding cell elongation regulator Jag/EloR [Spirochaetota bacterium]HNT09959.1 RNA-binding cell elongation regulator Jag/EloR [Spirochaetota bacterium]HNV45709.1 RNA-binding cell elongation regulator Jag/EloR [Spirochaetota bacterium]HOS38392.1 RNA-binding cell elongation regulator Jag/EloR [Spirochaetota bacterium]HPI21606.1 RNA-binding cell elongation regulator Jag/EloR [Spirochaetota bacterium]